jgi:hypothetical protein
MMNEARHNEAMERAVDGRPAEKISMGNWRQMVREVVAEHPGVFIGGEPEPMPVTAGKAFAVMVFEMAPGGGVHHGGMFKRGGWASAGDQVKRVEEPGVSAKLALALVERVVKWELGAVGALVSGVADEGAGVPPILGDGDAGHPSVQSAGEGMNAEARLAVTVEADAVVDAGLGRDPEVRGGLPAAQSDDGATVSGERCDGGERRGG